MSAARCSWLASMLLLMAACPQSQADPVEAQACERMGQRCKLPDGPIGVCNHTGETDCASPPCLECMPQH